MGFKATFIDLAHWVLSKETKSLQKSAMKTQVKSALHLKIKPAEARDILEEVTEKIKEAAEADPYYSRMFERPSQKK